MQTWIIEGPNSAAILHKRPGNRDGLFFAKSGKKARKQCEAFLALANHGATLASLLKMREAGLDARSAGAALEYHITGKLPEESKPAELGRNHLSKGIWFMEGSNSTAAFKAKPGGGIELIHGKAGTMSRKHVETYVALYERGATLDTVHLLSKTGLDARSVGCAISSFLGRQEGKVL